MRCILSFMPVGADAWAYFKNSPADSDNHVAAYLVVAAIFQLCGLVNVSRLSTGVGRSTLSAQGPR